jgi:hypothetical protein
MTYGPGALLRTEQGKHRLHMSLNVLCISTACICTALIARAGQRIYGWANDDCAIIDGLTTDTIVQMPLVGPVENALRGFVPSEIAINVIQRNEPFAGAGGPRIKGILINVICPVFVEFYEDHLPWLKANVSPKDTQWPSVWQFGRVVRNAVSHGGCCKIDDPKFVSVQWRGLIYGPAQNKRPILDTDLTFADMLILMFEMSDAMDDLGCPVSGLPLST